MKNAVRITISTSEGQEIRLECGDHSPLWVLHEELERVTSIAVKDQALCLLNEKGDEGELLEDPNRTLRDYDITDGSMFFLSSLAVAASRSLTHSSPRTRPASRGASGASAAAAEEGGAAAVETMSEADIAAREHEAERRARHETREWCDAMHAQRAEERSAFRRLHEMDSAAPAAVLPPQTSKVCCLVTQKKPPMAEHSFNGVMFDVQAKAPFGLVIKSVHIGGMLGQVSVFVCTAGSWCSDKTCLRQTGYGHRYAVQDDQHWKTVAYGRYRPSWDNTTEVVFDAPVSVLPGHTAAFYVHSALPDDLGIQYQTTPRVAVVDQDEHLRIFPGVGHTSSTPFDQEYGWYRYPRCLAGKLGYEARLLSWIPRDHKVFPSALKAAVKTMLMCQGSRESTLSMLPPDVVMQVMENCSWDWFGVDTMEPEPEQDEDDAPPHGRHMIPIEIGGKRIYVPWNVLRELGPQMFLQGSDEDESEPDESESSDSEDEAAGQDTASGVEGYVHDPDLDELFDDVGDGIGEGMDYGVAAAPASAVPAAGGETGETAETVAATDADDIDL